ncbi:hypothetical protein TREES_T100017715 [Tupaia chinensis]|uniref:Uncharacterized protein n=1 Tax=Tupaia chinensis TaxID=246437 RepID=L9KSC1_TUPCH|nr:hypothetical protein TREES_T100017715 [Tupaia chinensis]
MRGLYPQKKEEEEDEEEEKDDKKKNKEKKKSNGPALTFTPSDPPRSQDERRPLMCTGRPERHQRLPGPFSENLGQGVSPEELHSQSPSTRDPGSTASPAAPLRTSRVPPAVNTAGPRPAPCSPARWASAGGRRGCVPTCR